MSLAVVDFMLVQNNYFSFNRQVYNQNLYRIFKVLKSLRALRAIRVMRKLRLEAEPHSLSTDQWGAGDTDLGAPEVPRVQLLCLCSQVPEQPPEGDNYPSAVLALYHGHPHPHVHLPQYPMCRAGGEGQEVDRKGGRGDLGGQDPCELSDPEPSIQSSSRRCSGHCSTTQTPNTSRTFSRLSSLSSPCSPWMTGHSSTCKIGKPVRSEARWAGDGAKAGRGAAEMGGEGPGWGRAVGDLLSACTLCSLVPVTQVPGTLSPSS